MIAEIKKLNQSVDQYLHCMAHPDKHPAHLRVKYLKEMQAANEVVKQAVTPKPIKA